MEELQVISEPIKFGTFDLSNDHIRKLAYEAVVSRMDSVKNDHTSRCEKFKTWEEMYSSSTVNQTKETLSRVNTTQVWNSVEDWTAQIVDATFSVEPPIKIKSVPGNKIIPADVAEKIKLVLWKNAKDTNFYEEFEQTIREGVKLGTFSAKVTMNLDELPTLSVKETPRSIDINGMPLPMPPQKVMSQEVVVEDRPVFKHSDIRNLYFRPDKVTWVIEKVDTSWSVIEKQARLFGLYGNLEKAKTTSYPSENIEQKEREALDLDKEVCLWEAHHIPITFTKDCGVPDEYVDKSVLCIITIANEREVIRIQPTPYRAVPYLIVPFIPKTKSSYGIGICQIVEQLAIEFNTRRNQSLDANTFGLYCMVVANTKYIKKMEQLKIRPNGVIEVKGVDRPLSEVVQFVRPPVEYVAAAQNLLDRIESEIARSTRLRGTLAGEKIAPNPSATEAAAMLKESMKSVKIILRRVDLGLIQEYFKRCYELMVLNRQKPWYVAIEGLPGIQPQVEQFIEVLPSEIYTDGINVEVLGSSHVDNEIITRNQNMQLLDLMAKYSQLPMTNPQGIPVKFNFQKALNEILLSFGKTRPEDWWQMLPPPPPMMGPGGPPPGPPGPPMRPSGPQAPIMGNRPPDMRRETKRIMNRPSRGI
jgi:hypothetical protein